MDKSASSDQETFAFPTADANLVMGFNERRVCRYSLLPPCCKWTSLGRLNERLLANGVDGGTPKWTGVSDSNKWNGVLWGLSIV